MAQGGVSPDGKFLAKSNNGKPVKELSALEKLAWSVFGIGALALIGYFGYELKKDYKIVKYNPGDEKHWVKIHELADHFNKVNLETFHVAFGKLTEELSERQFYLENNYLVNEFPSP